MKKEKENNNYIIYKATNIFNDLIYVGATTNTIHQRKLDHTERANREEQGKFQEAIHTYGKEAFKWEQIDTANSIDELAKKEQEYIYEYNSKGEGYNSSIGGEFKKTVYQYSLEDRSLVKSYDCLKDASVAMSTTKQIISKTCLSVNKFFKGFYWSYDLMEKFEPSIDKRRKKVIQKSLDGIKIAEYNSVAEASRQTGVSRTCIARVCRGEREKSSGFRWCYEL